MAERSQVPVITLGGKGSSLSSSSVYAIANGLSQVCIDNSALDRLFSSNNGPSTSNPNQLALPNSPLNLEEHRASLVVLLGKLLNLSESVGIRTVIPIQIAESLNESKISKITGLGSMNLTQEEALALGGLESFSSLLGISALLDHQSSTLWTLVDVVSAMSCEASRADVTTFSSFDSGDGFVVKEEVGVAGDMKVLLNGSKLVGKVENEAVSIIPKVHGSLREQAKLLHSKIRIELNCSLKIGKNGPEIKGVAEALQAPLLALTSTLQNLGNFSLMRAKRNLESIGIDNLQKSMADSFVKKCPSCDSLENVGKLILELAFKKEQSYDKFAHEVNALLGIVWNIVAWEAITAFVALEGENLSEKNQNTEVNGGMDVKGEKKGEKKKKKKKLVLGKGTDAVVQLIKDRLPCKRDDADSGLLETIMEDILLFLNPKDPGMDGLLIKIKEIVESNETRRLPKLPKGTRDFAKEQMTIRKNAFTVIEEVFERHGATMLDTPVFELRETLTGKYGEDSKLIYDLADQGGELCSLRYDLTVPFARYMAMNGLTSLKRYQIAKVYRRDNPSKGRFREFYQCDFDIAGQNGKMGPDFEVVYVMTELLNELNIGEYEIKLNHRKLLDAMLEICGVPPEKFRTICSSIDKLDKQSFEQIKREMVEEKGLRVETADNIGDFVKERGRPLELLSKLKQAGSKFLENSTSIDALNDLEILFKALDKSKSIEHVVFDLSLARGLDYYTGVIFEAVFKGGAQVGSIGAGGRYDNLIGMFGTKQVPAVGVSLGIERVFAIMEQQNKDQNQTIRATKTEVLVSILGDDVTIAAELASELWNAKLETEYLVSKKMMKHIEYALEFRIPWMIIVGERELSEGFVKLKDVEAKKEENIPRNAVVEELQRRLNHN